MVFFLIYYVEGEMINSLEPEITNSLLNLTTTENERNSKMNTLKLIQSQLEENNSKLQELKSGDKYHLYDPTMKDVSDFLNNTAGKLPLVVE